MEKRSPAKPRNSIAVKSLTVPVCFLVTEAIFSEVTPKKVDTKTATSGTMNMMLYRRRLKIAFALSSGILMINPMVGR